MFKNLKKKLEAGVAQSPLKNILTSDGHSGDVGDDTKSPNVSLNDSMSAYSTPLNHTLNESHANQSAVENAGDQQPEDPMVAQLIDIPLSDDSPAHSTPLHNQHTYNNKERRLSSSSILSDSTLFPPLNISAQSFIVPSDVESVMSEYDQPTMTTEGYTKDDLYDLLQKRHFKANKYKSKFQELVMAYKTLSFERDKIKSTLTQSQDRAFRRITELKEQINLDAEAKKDVEQNYQLMLDEKEELLKVLKTQVSLLKEGKDVPEDALVDIAPNEKEAENKELIGLREKVTKLEGLLSRCKDKIKSNNDKLTTLNKEKGEMDKEMLAREQRISDLLHTQESGDNDNNKLRSQIDSARKVIEELESDKVIAIATVKQQMHISLEEKDTELGQIRASLHEKEALVKQTNEELETLRKNAEQQTEKAREIIKRLKDEKKGMKEESSRRIEEAEAKLEEEKQTLIAEIQRGKAAAITLLQEDTARKMDELKEANSAALIERDALWEGKMAALGVAHQDELTKKDKEMEAALEVKDEQVLRRLSEKEDNVRLAMEERDLQKIAALCEQDNRQDGLLEKISDLNAENIRLENALTKIQEDYQTRVEKLNHEHEEIVSNIRFNLETVQDQFNNSLATAEQTHNEKLQTTVTEKCSEIDVLAMKYQQLKESSRASKEMLEERVQILISQVEQQTNTSDVATNRVLELENVLAKTQLQLKTAQDSSDGKEHLLTLEREKLGTLGTEAKKRIRDLKEQYELSTKEYESEKAASQTKFFEEISKKDTEINTMKLKFESEKNKELQLLRDEITKYQNMAEAFKMKFTKKQAEHEENVKKLNEECNMKIKSKENEMEEVLGGISGKEGERFEERRVELVKEYERKIQETEERGRVEVDGLREEYEKRIHETEESGRVEVDGLREEYEGMIDGLKLKIDEVSNLKNEIASENEKNVLVVCDLERRIEDLSQNRDDVVSENCKNTERVEELERLLRESDEKNHECDKEIGELRGQIENQLTQAVLSQTDEIAMLQEKIVEIQGRLAEKESEMHNLNEEHRNMINNLKREHLDHVEEMEIAVKSKVESASSELTDKYDGIIGSLKEEMDASSKEHDSVVGQLHDRIKEMQNNCQKSATDLQEIQSRCTVLENENCDLTNVKEQLKNELSDSTDMCQKHVASIEEKDSLIGQYSGKIENLELSQSSLKDMLSVIQDEKTSNDDKNDSLLANLNDMQQKLEEKSEVILKLEQKLADSQKTENQLKEERENSLTAMQSRIDELVSQNTKMNEELVGKEESWNVSLEKAQIDQKLMEESYIKQIDTLKEENAKITSDFDANSNDVSAKIEQFKTLETELRKELEEAQVGQKEQSRLLEEKENMFGEFREKFDKLKAKSQSIIQKLKGEKENLEKDLEERIKTLTEEHSLVVLQLETEKNHTIDDLRKESETNLKVVIDKYEVVNSELREKIDNMDIKHAEVLKGKVDEMEKAKDDHNLVIGEYQEKLGKYELAIKDHEEKLTKMNEKCDLLIKDNEEHLGNLKEKHEVLMKDYEMKIIEINETHEKAVSEIQERSNNVERDHELEMKKYEEKLNESNLMHENSIKDYEIKLEDNILKINKLTLDNETQSMEFGEEKNRLMQSLQDFESQAKVRSEDFQKSVQNNLSDSQKQILEIHERHSQELTDVEERGKQKFVEIKQKYVAKLKEMKAQQSEDLKDKNDENDVLKKHIKDLRINIGNDKEKLENINDENDILKKQIEELKINNSNDKEKLKDLLRKEVSDSDAKISDLEQRLQNAIQETNKVCSELNVSNTKLLRIEELTHLTDDKIDNLEKTNAELLRELDIRKEKIDILTSELGHVNNIRKEKQELDIRIEELGGGVLERESLITSLRSDLQYAADEQNKLNSDIDRIVLEGKNRAVDLEKEIDEMKAKQVQDIEDIREKIQSENEGKVAEYKKKAETYLSQMKKQFIAEKESCVAQFETEIANVTADRDKLSNEISSLKAENDRCVVNHKKVIEDLKKEHEIYINEMTEKLQDYTMKFQSSESEQNDIAKKIQNFEGEKEVLNGRLALMEQTHADDCDKYEEKLTILEKDKSKLNDQIIELNDDTGKLKLESERELKRLHKEYETTISDLEVEHSSKVKQLVKEFNVKMASKDREYEDYVDGLAGKSSNDTERLHNEHKIEMSALYQDLHDKDLHIETLNEQHTMALKEKEEEIKKQGDDYESQITALRSEISSSEEKRKDDAEDIEWRVEERIRERLRRKEEEMTALSEEWQNERKLMSSEATNGDITYESLVEQNERFLAAVQSGSTDGSTVRQTVLELSRQQERLTTQHRLEMSELRSQLEMRSSRLEPLVAAPGERDVFTLYEKEAAEEIQNLELHNLDLESHVAHMTNEVKSREQREALLQQHISKLEIELQHVSSLHGDHEHGLLEDGFPSGPLLTEPTEMEYLRNILYEYMMGKETKTLAKVITTVLHFSDEQRAKVLNRENSRLQKWLPPLT